jgi:GT2 family glycosyltransferase
LVIFRRIAALGASYNRKELTLASLESLFAQSGVAQIELTVFLIDDASPDGTAEAVSLRFPQVRLLCGNGSLYWNGAMRVAFAAAMREGFDAYLWFNDDSLFYEDALKRLVDCAESASAEHLNAIVAGSMCDPQTGERTYGGYKKRTHGLQWRLEPLVPDENSTLPCDTVNGNFTLVPAAIVKALGNLDETFTHQFGDVDYGLRARMAGFQLLVAPGYLGECSGNSDEHTWRDSTWPRKKRWAQLMSPKGAPFREWWHFTRRHCGWRCPLYAVSPYLKTLFF